MKITFLNRSKLLAELELLEPKKWLFKLDDPRELPWQFSGTANHIHSIDPPGGPYISVGATLENICRGLPQDHIVGIANDTYAVDPSGYEYTGWIITTA